MDQAAQVRQKIDLVALISEFIPLKKMGANFKSNCPFHNEKSPSFVVSPERQIWHCFGCGKGGDCFSFLMEYENIEFIEALKTLGKRTGIEIEFSSKDIGISSQKEKIYRMNKLAADFYHYILTKHNAGTKALQYLLEKRKINPKVLETFVIGFAPSTKSALSNYLVSKKGFKKQDVVDAGLGSFRNGEVFDFFFNRIMFPLSDHRGNIIGFSGRIMDEGSSSSKYVNTRETPAYHKGEVFFGLNRAKDEIKKKQEVFIMEGEFDVISSFEQGFGNAVAVKGTALTDSQVQLISRFAGKVILCFDMDSAGFEALKRSLPLLEKRGLTTDVLVLSEGKDPDEAIKLNPLNFKKAAEHPVGVYDYLISKVSNLFDKKSVDGKKKISGDLLPLLAMIENEILKEHYLKKLAAELDVSLESMYRQLEKIKVTDTKIVTSTTVKDSKTRAELMEQYLLALIVQSKNQSEALEEVNHVLSEFSFTTPSFEKLYQLLKTYLDKNILFKIDEFTKEVPKELLPAFDTCYLLPLPKFEKEKQYTEELEKTIKNLKELYIREKIKEISEAIKHKEKESSSKSEEELEVLNHKLTTYINMLGSQTS